MRFLITFLFGLFINLALLGQATDIRGTDFWFTFNEQFETPHDQYRSSTGCQH